MSKRQNSRKIRKIRPTRIVRVNPGSISESGFAISPTLRVAPIKITEPNQIAQFRAEHGITAERAIARNEFTERELPKTLFAVKMLSNRHSVRQREYLLRRYPELSFRMVQELGNAQWFTVRGNMGVLYQVCKSRSILDIAVYYEGKGLGNQKTSLAPLSGANKRRLFDALASQSRNGLNPSDIYRTPIVRRNSPTFPNINPTAFRSAIENERLITATIMGACDYVAISFVSVRDYRDNYAEFYVP